MSFKIPEPAVEYFDNEANAITLLLEHHILSPTTNKNQVESSASHQFIAANITESDIVKISSFGSIDPLGQKTSHYFSTEQGMFGFSGENYERVLKLINSLSRKKELQSLLSEKFLIDSFFEWIEKRYKNQISMSQNFIHYLQKKTDNEIKQIKISIPIDYLVIEEPFVVGHITFEFYTKDFFDN